MSSETSSNIKNTQNGTIYSCLAESLEKNGSICIQLLKKVRNDLTEESVHQIRVIVRKLEAGLELLESLGIHQKNLSKDLKNIRKIHSQLRNIHVELALVKNFEGRINLKLFKVFLKKREHKFEMKLLEELDFISIDKLNISLQKIVHNLLQKDSPKINKKAFAQMEDQVSKITLDFEKTKKSYSLNSTESIHAIRIAAKRLRYQVEILKPVIKVENKKLQQLKSIQEILGKIQNNIVLQKSIDKFFNKQCLSGCKPVFELQTIAAKEQQVLLGRFNQIKVNKLNRLIP